MQHFHHSGKNEIHMHAWAMKRKLCNFDGFMYELNALLFAFKTSIALCKDEQWNSHEHFKVVFFLKLLAPLIIYLFIYWLCWVFVSVQGLPLVAASGGHSSSWCAGLSLSRPLLLRSTGSRRAGSAVVAHGPSCSAACGILPDQGSNPCPLH